MIWYTCNVCAHLDRRTGGKCTFLDGELKPLPLAIVSGDTAHMKKWPGQNTDLVFQLAPEFREIEIVISNKDRYPAAAWLEQSEFQSIGFFGGDYLTLVGFEFPPSPERPRSRGEGALVIAWDAPYVKGDLLAFNSDYEGMDDEMREFFEGAQKEMDAMPDRLEFRAIELNSLLSHSPMDVNLIDYGSWES
jgi:hypothetical protein